MLCKGENDDDNYDEHNFMILKQRFLFSIKNICVCVYVFLFFIN